MPKLKTILRLNAASCLGFGALFVAHPLGVAAFLGSPPAPVMLVIALGAALIGNGILLLYASRTGEPRDWLVWVFSGGDFAWVIATVLLVTTQTWVTTLPGIVAALAVGVGVGTLGLLQLVARKPVQVAP